MPRRPTLVLSRLERAVTPRTRRAVLALALVAFAVLSVFPRRHTARMKIMAPQSAASGLGQLLAQLGGLSGLAPLLSSRQPVEVYMLLARSFDVRQEVARRTAIQQRFGAKTLDDAVIELDRHVEVHALRGGVIEIEAVLRDPQLALSIANAFGSVFQERLATLAKQEVAKKRTLMNDQLLRASERLVAAEEALTKYRTTNRVASPEAQLGSSVSLLATLRGRLQAKEVELTTARRFATPESYEVQRVQSEIEGLRREIAKAEQANEKNDPFGFQGFANKSNEYVRLYRDYKYAEALYEVYQRYLEAVNIEEVSSDVTVQVLETPYLDPEITLSRWAIGLAVLTVLVAGFLEVRAYRAALPAEA